MFFTREKGKQYELQGYLRRICDLTSPNLPRMDEDRDHDRQNRTIPVLLTPWDQGMPVVGETTTALTRDISDSGLSLTMAQPCHVEEVVVGFWLPDVQGYEPWFFQGCVRHNVAIGGWFWALGIEAKQLLAVSAIPELELLLPMVKRLLPSQGAKLNSPTAPAGR